jgi:hypothetical protein
LVDKENKNINQLLENWMEGGEVSKEKSEETGENKAQTAIHMTK